MHTVQTYFLFSQALYIILIKQLGIKLTGKALFGAPFITHKCVQTRTHAYRVRCGKKVKYQERDSAKVQCLNSINSRLDRQHKHTFSAVYEWLGVFYEVITSKQTRKTSDVSFAFL